MTRRHPVEADPTLEARGSVEDDLADAPDLAALPIAGITRRRAFQVASGLAVAWLVVAFLRQVGDVTAASSRADGLRVANATLAQDVAALENELRLIQRQDYVTQQARAFRLGSPREIPFTLDQPAPSLGPDAPGSASVRLGADLVASSPLDSWLGLLFGRSSSGQD
jgi:cell division protein FtsB